MGQKPVTLKKNLKKREQSIRLLKRKLREIILPVRYMIHSPFCAFEIWAFEMQIVELAQIHIVKP
jgi:hypothetical protein